MKKKFHLLVLILCCISCDTTPTPDFKPAADRKYYVNKFEYEGHEYIQFSATFDSRSRNGIVHNPRCKYCREN